MYLADCIAKLCEWDHLCDQFGLEGENERYGKMLESLHVLVKHPEAYQEMTGKNPDVARHEYDKVLSVVSRFL